MISQAAFGDSQIQMILDAGDLHNIWSPLIPTYVKEFPTLYISGCHRLYFYITEKHGQRFMFHKAKINNRASMVRYLTSPQHI